MSDILKNNLNNVKKNTDLFGNEVNALGIKERIGFVPISIWQPDWEKVKALKAIIGDSGQSRKMTISLQNFRSIGWSGPDKPQKISIFNPHLAQMILSAYCPQNAKIFDPFGGGGTRGFVASAMGFDYTGIEIRQEEVDGIIEQQKILDLKFNIICGDSKGLELENNYFDFSFTCPPYYNLEIYSNDKDDLSNAPTYTDFIDGIQKVIEITYKTLKPGGVAVWVVGNFRNEKTGALIHFSGDTISMAKTVGFKLWDELIFWGASTCAAQRAGQFAANRKSVRVHEYVLIFKK